jgi:hypothetical protein
MVVSFKSDLLEHFNEMGFVVARGLLDIDSHIKPVIDEYVSAIDLLERKWLSEGKINRTYSNLPFDKRLGKLIIETKGEVIHHLDVALKSGSMVTLSEDDPNIHHGPAVFNLLTNQIVLDAVEQFIGPEIYVNPVNRLRVKPPERLLPETMRKNDQVSKTFWHQDQGVIREDADSTNLLTVWIPLTEATVENGCLAVIPGSHKNGLALHCFTEELRKTGGHGIPKDLLSELTPVPMKPGDVFFQHKHNIHGSLSNVSEEDVRISFDLRYQPVGQNTGVHLGPFTSSPRDVSTEPLTWPGFIARSKSNPSAELRDNEEWGRLWAETRSKIIEMNAVGKLLRWDPFDPRCG